MGVPLKIKIGTALWSIKVTFWYLSEENEHIKWKRYTHSKFIAVLFTIVKIGKQTKCPSIDDWIKKINIYTYICVYIYTHSGILFSHKMRKSCHLSNINGH